VGHCLLNDRLLRALQLGPESAKSSSTPTEYLSTIGMRSSGITVHIFSQERQTRGEPRRRFAEFHPLRFPFWLQTSVGRIGEAHVAISDDHWRSRQFCRCDADQRLPGISRSGSLCLVSGAPGEHHCTGKTQQSDGRRLGACHERSKSRAAARTEGGAECRFPLHPYSGWK
jgi:hypothetical protein